MDPTEIANHTVTRPGSHGATSIRPSFAPRADIVFVTEYKSGERKKIVDADYRIILNVGDQLSDLNGNPLAERSVKLPNPFYYIP